MPLYSNTTFIPPIIPPGLEVARPDPNICKDERIKISEVEAAFEKFEHELSVQLCHNINPVGKSVPGFPLTSDDFSLPGASHTTRPGTTRTALNSPFYINESLNMDNDMNETDFSNSGSIGSRHSAGRLPRRVVPPRSIPSFNSNPLNNLTPATSVRRPAAYANSSSNPRDPSQSLTSFLNNWSGEAHTTGGTTTETESGDTYIEPEDEHVESDAPPLPPPPKPWTAVRVAKTFLTTSLFTGAAFMGYELFSYYPVYKGPEIDLKGKTVLVTEPTARSSGALLKGLARRGANIILPTATLTKCDALRDKLIRSTRVNSNRLDCRELDLNSMTSIRRFAASILTDYPNIDVAIVQTPGGLSSMVPSKKRTTPDGFEYQMGTNYFATFLLCRLLWNRLNESQGRLIFVVDPKAGQIALESAQRTPDTNQVKLPMDDLNFDGVEKYEPRRGFERSQWFVSLFANELIHRSANELGASVMLVSPLVTKRTAGDKTAGKSVLMAAYDKLYESACRLTDRRAHATTLFCAIADPEKLQLTGTLKQNVPVRAPLYQDLGLVPPSNPSKIDDCRSAADLLWAVSDKWTRLDTHPNPTPLPSRPAVVKRSTEATPHMNQATEAALA